MYYGLEAGPLIQSQLRSLEFAVSSAFRKTFSIKSYDVVSDCVKYFNCSVPNSMYKRKANFFAKLKCSDNVFIHWIVLECYFYGIVRSATELCTHSICA